MISIATIREMRLALTKDLNSSASQTVTKVVDDAVRKTFTANKDGAVLEFAHRQPDTEFWNGMKYYGSGKSNKIRFLRTKRAGKI